MISRPCYSICLGLAALFSRAQAVTTFNDTQMTAYLDAGGRDLAYNYAPVFFFSQALSHPPTLPTWAFSGTPSSPDIYDAAHQTAPGAQCQYPDVGCDSRNPATPPGTQAPAFPIYYTTRRCADAEVRVAYNLYYQKDGARVLFVDTGHAHDWERVIVIHARDAAGTWHPARALYSAHSGYNAYDWNDIHGTLTHADAESGAGPAPANLRGLDHPKAYVSWSKHAHFDTAKTQFLDAVSQSTPNAYRLADWWRFAAREHLVRADLGTPAGRALGAADWGDATSDPVTVQDALCGYS